MIDQEFVKAANAFELHQGCLSAEQYEQTSAILSAAPEFQAWAATPQFKAAKVIQKECEAAQSNASEAWRIARCTPQAEAYASLLKAAKEQFKNGN